MWTPHIYDATQAEIGKYLKPLTIEQNNWVVYKNRHVPICKNSSQMVWTIY